MVKNQVHSVGERELTGSVTLFLAAIGFCRLLPHQDQGCASSSLTSTSADGKTDRKK